MDWLKLLGDASFVVGVFILGAVWALWAVDRSERKP